VVSRDADSAGVVVGLRLAQGKPKAPGSYWRGGQLVIINRMLYMDTMQGVQPGLFGQGSLSAFSREVEAALKLPAAAPFAAVAEVTVEE
jgi:hypothetical protein